MASESLFHSPDGLQLEGNGVIGIAKEGRYKWERRAPLTPAQCGRLLRLNLSDATLAGSKGDCGGESGAGGREGVAISAAEEDAAAAAAAGASLPVGGSNLKLQQQRREGHSSMAEGGARQPGGGATGRRLRIVVQRSSKRVFSDAQYEDVGCELADDLSECGLILGVKQPEVRGGGGEGIVEGGLHVGSEEKMRRWRLPWAEDCVLGIHRNNEHASDRYPNSMHL